MHSDNERRDDGERVRVGERTFNYDVQHVSTSISPYLDQQTV